MKLLNAPDLTISCVQLASGGAWERAVNVADCTGDWIEKSGENIAIEVVYLERSGELVGFIGFRKIISDAAERRAFWQAITSEALLYEHDTPRAQISIWLAKLNLSCIIDIPPKVIELGVFNLWQSAGTIRQTSERFALSKALNAPTWLAEGAEAPICKESSWDIGDGFWVADNVSTKVDSRYYLCAEQLAEF